MYLIFHETALPFNVFGTMVVHTFPDHIKIFCLSLVLHCFFPSETCISDATPAILILRLFRIRCWQFWSLTATNVQRLWSPGTLTARNTPSSTDPLIPFLNCPLTHAVIAMLNCLAFFHKFVFTSADKEKTGSRIVCLIKHSISGAAMLNVSHYDHYYKKKNTMTAKEAQMRQVHYLKSRSSGLCLKMEVA
jgi:hypothetical protein